MKYGIGSIWSRSNPKLLKKLPLSTINPFNRIAYIACCEDLPEMKFETITEAISALNDEYVDKAYIKETDKGVETNICYIIDQNHNLIAILNYDKTIIMNKEINNDIN